MDSLRLAVMIYIQRALAAEDALLQVDVFATRGVVSSLYSKSASGPSSRIFMQATRGGNTQTVMSVPLTQSPGQPLGERDGRVKFSKLSREMYEESVPAVVGLSVGVGVTLHRPRLELAVVSTV